MCKCIIPIEYAVHLHESDRKQLTSEFHYIYNDNVRQSKKECSNLIKTTMTDIAKYCGVSLKTVSRVINHSEHVSEDTRKKVEAAMNDLNYQVNLMARGLKQSRMNIIIVFLDRHNDEYLNSWRNIMLRHLFRYTRSIGMKIIVSPSDSQKYLEDETDGFYLLSSGIADGAILLEYVYKDQRVAYLEDTKTPYVVLGQPKETNVHAVSFDNYHAGYLGGAYLQKRNYKNICFITGERQYFSVESRVRGFQDALKESGSNGKVYYGVHTIEETYHISRRILEEEDVDCFFVSGDERAMGVYKAIYEKQLKIPEDIAVMGIDNLPMSEFLYPPLSSIKQDFDLLAKECIFMLEELLNQSEYAKPIQKLIPSEIVERTST